jgi:hypothetical protein
MRHFLLLVLLLFSSTLYSQEYTENLIDYTGWINAGSVGEPLTCWGPGDPGYCGPLPAVGAFNNPSLINFSYGLTDIYQPVDIAQALNAAGSGIIVNGFSFNFIAKNGNGWDNGQLDYLTAYAEFYKGNDLLESYNYDLNYRFNWTNFNYSETFTNPYQINDLDEVKVGFVGRDTNGWAGFYGPEVRNIDFRLNYGIDPCYEDPLSSTSCAGFQAALLELQCNGDPLSSIDCPGYLENFMSEIDMNLDDVFEDEMYDEYIEELYEEFLDEEFFDEELIADEEFLDEELIADEEFLDEELIADEEFLDEGSLDEESILSLLELVEALNSTNDKPVDSLSAYDSNTIMENQIVETIISTSISNIRTDDITNSAIQENIIRAEVSATQLAEQSVGSDSLITEITDQDETQVEDIVSESAVDGTLIVENDTEEELETIVAISSLSSNINETNIETLLSDNTVQENNTETVVVISEQVSNEEETSVENVVAQEETNNNEETTNQSFDDVALISEISLDVVTTAASTFNNNSMQQVLALGGTITEILNTPVPDFSRYEVKPPSQEEEVQTAKVENTLESMSTEEIESQAEMRIGSMDPESQAIALQLIGYKPGFDQYGGMLVDQSNWYLDRGMYTNNRVPSSNSNLIFGVQDQRHQELMSLQYRR